MPARHILSEHCKNTPTVTFVNVAVYLNLQRRSSGASYAYVLRAGSHRPPALLNARKYLFPIIALAFFMLLKRFMHFMRFMQRLNFILPADGAYVKKFRRIFGARKLAAS